MATGAQPTSDPLQVAPWREADTADSKSEQYLARRFAAASAEYRSEALTTFLMGLALGVLTWLLVGVLLEHWLVPGGLPRTARWAWLATGGVAVAAAVIRWGLPPLLRRVNVVYAARAFERQHPELHNDLVNAVLVKHKSGALSEPVVKSIRRRAARQLSRVPDDLALHGVASVLAWILAGLVGFACLYQILAPKSLITSASRLLVPWVNIAPPARVQIEPPRLSWRMAGEDPVGADQRERALTVVRGEVELARGRQLMLTTQIDGLSAGEKPELIVTPLLDDGRTDPAATAWRVPLVSAGDGRRQAVVPDTARGLDQSVSLMISAGDARTEPIRVMAVDAPMVIVRELRYHYPAYTGREPETVAWQGDIRGLEGTKVTVVAKSNRLLETVAIDLGCDGRRDVALPLAGPDSLQGNGTFTLRMAADRTGPEFASYRFMYRPRSSAGTATEPDVIGQLEHRIEVVPDLAPEVVIESPEQKVVRVPPDAPVTVRVRASDPDFAVASVRVETRLRGREGIRKGDSLLVGKPRQAFRGAATLIPRPLGAEPGSVLEYRAVAVDTRPDSPNESATEWRALEIDAAAPPQPTPEPENQRPDDSDQEPDRGDQEQGESGSEPGDQPDQPEAAERDRQQKESKPDGQQGGSKEGDQAGEQQSDQGAEGGEQGGQPGERMPDQSGRDKPGSEQGGNQQGNQQGQQDGNQRGEQQGNQQGQQQGNQQGEQGNQQGEQEGNQQGEQQGEQGNQQGEQEGAQQGNQQGQQQGESNAGSPSKESGGTRQPGEGGREGSPDQGRPQAGGGEGDSSESGQPESDEKGLGRGESAAGKAAAKPKPSVAADGTDDGEAMERILENRRRESEDDPSQPNGEGQRSPQDEGEDKQQSREQETCDKNGQPCGKPGCSACNGSGEGKPGEGKPGEGKPGEGKPGEGKPGEGKPGEGKPGEGKPGEGKPGEGKPGEGKPGEGKPGEGKPGEGKPGEGKPGEGKPGEGKPGEGKPGAEAGSPTGSVGTGGAAGGGQGEQMAGEPLEQREMEWNAQSADQAHNAANLAIEHLRRSLAEERSEVLDELGWTRDQALAFLKRWEAMQQLAQSGDPSQRAEFDRSVRSLGLRPDGLQRSRDVPTDVRGGQAEGRRTRPPSDYREQFKAFMQGTSVP